MGILQTRIWLPQIPLSRFAPLCGTPNPGQKSGTGKSSGTRLEIPPVSRANRNVWSAALPQAKSDVTGWSAQMYAAFVGVNHSWPGWNALRSFPH
jgi:hypothetical protein